ncbi:MAG: phospholipase D-like domain-containing protein [Cyanobacteriota bacterium]
MSLGLLNNIKVHGQLEQKKPNNLLAFRGSNGSLPVVEHATPAELDPVKLPGVPKELAVKIIEAANDTGVSVGEYLGVYLRHLTSKVKGVLPEPSVTANVGKTAVTTLIDAKQIFDKVTDYIKSAEKSIQVEMFEFQNLKIDSDIWPSGGAESIPGWDKQQQILDMLIKKKKQNPKINIQVILDVHKWYQDGFGNYKRHYANMKMIRHLKENGIDVVPYPRPKQGGTILQHVKFMAVDGKKAILGGMNWGNHSSANHDACIAIETLPKQSNSEVDNMIDQIFNKDWKFAWQRLGQTKLVAGPTKPEEQDQYKGRAKKIKPEDVEYMKIVGELFDKPEYRNRYKEGNLNIVEVKPLDKPAIQVLTNSPREYKLIGDQGSESIGNYIKQKLDTCDSLTAELFVLSHKEIVNKIIARHKEAQKKGGRPFKAEILISPGILDDFPYCRYAAYSLQKAGVPIRMFNVNKDLTQRLHTKWAVFEEKGKQDLLIGSANWSAVGLENNVATGKREDYPITNKLIDKRISEYQERVSELEKELKLQPVYNEKGIADIEKVKERNKAIKADLSSIDSEDFDKVETVKLNKLDSFLTLLGYYDLILNQEERREKFKRGNHECAVVVPNNKISGTFIKQFAKDWKHSEPIVPEGYGEFDETYLDDFYTEGVDKEASLPDKMAALEAYKEAKAEISFKGDHNRFNRVV